MSGVEKTALEGQRGGRRGQEGRVLTRILKIGVKCCPPEKVGVLPYLSIETFLKVGVRNEKLE